MKRLILASNNKKKIIEMKEILKDLNIEVKSLENENINIDVDYRDFEKKQKQDQKQLGIRFAHQLFYSLCSV